MATSTLRSRGRSRGTKVTTNSTTNSTSSKSTGPYDRNFAQHLIDFGIYPAEYERPDGSVLPAPENFDLIMEKLRTRRKSLSPSRFSDTHFRAFKKANANAFKEKEVATSVIPHILGSVSDSRCASGGIPFNNLEHLTDGTLKPGNPDFYRGARPEQLDRGIRNEFSRLIIPSTQDDLPVLPNFFLAAKGPDGTAAVAKRQACYDGALGARGINSLRSLGSDMTSQVNKALPITSSYIDGQLKMYTTHLQIPDAGNRLEYVMTQLGAYAMTNSVQTFREGATAFRNGYEFTQQERNGVIDQANTSARADTSACDLPETDQDTCNAIDQLNGATSDGSAGGDDTTETSPAFSDSESELETSQGASRKHLSTPPTRVTSLRKRRTMGPETAAPSPRRNLLSLFLSLSRGSSRGGGKVSVTQEDSAIPASNKSF